jgi:hypothetical protein
MNPLGPLQGGKLKEHNDQANRDKDDETNQGSLHNQYSSNDQQ